MLSAIEATARDFEAIEGVVDVVEELVQKLPVEAVDAGTGLDVHDPATVHRLVDEAKQLLVGRLLRMGGQG
jgi:hypothetical protein